MRITPMADKIVIKRTEAARVTPGGIHIPDTAKEKPKQGKVLAVGNGKLLENGERARMDVQEGQTVLFTAYAGSDVTVDGEDFLILSESDVLAVIE